MSRPVYVLGAGFCRDFEPKMFPLAADFLETAKSWNRYLPDANHRELSQFIAMYFGDDTSPNIESVLSFLAATPFDDPRVVKERRTFLYDQLVTIILDTLLVASVTAKSRGQKATPWQQFPRDISWDIYSRFVKEELVDRRAIVITFNYDLLLEFLLLATNQWNMDDGYGIDIPLNEEAFPSSLRPKISRDTVRETVRSACMVLKPHGSINWGTPFSYRKGIDKSLIYRLADDGLLNLNVSESIEAPLRLFFRPVIVPPVQDKSTWLENASIRTLWNMAMEAVRRADEITFIGYSMPAADFLAEFMFRQGSIGQPKKCSVIAPDALELCKTRYSGVFGDSVVPVAKTFMSWITERYFPETAGALSRQFRKDDPARWNGVVIDWWGNNVAFKCGCGQAFIVSQFLGGGKRVCPNCKQTEGVVQKDGTATLLPVR